MKSIASAIIGTSSIVAMQLIEVIDIATALKTILQVVIAIITIFFLIKKNITKQNKDPDT